MLSGFVSGSESEQQALMGLGPVTLAESGVLESGLLITTSLPRIRVLPWTAAGFEHDSPSRVGGPVFR